MKKGSRVRHIKQSAYIGTVIQQPVKAVVRGQPAQLLMVRWDGNPPSFPIQWGDESSHGKKGYLYSELEEIDGSA